MGRSPKTTLPPGEVCPALFTERVLGAGAALGDTHRARQAPGGSQSDGDRQENHRGVHEGEAPSHTIHTANKSHFLVQGKTEVHEKETNETQLFRVWFLNCSQTEQLFSF